MESCFDRKFVAAEALESSKPQSSMRVTGKDCIGKMRSLLMTAGLICLRRYFLTSRVRLSAKNGIFAAHVGLPEGVCGVQLWYTERPSSADSNIFSPNLSLFENLHLTHAYTHMHARTRTHTTKYSKIQAFKRVSKVLRSKLPCCGCARVGGMPFS